MVIKKLLKLIFCILVSIPMYSCQDYIPGFNLNNFNNTPLSSLARAVKRQDVKKINKIVKQNNVDLEYCDPIYGNTLLMCAVSNDLDKSVEALLKLGADPNKEGKIKPEEGGNTTPLLVACTSYYKINECDTKVLELLIEYGGNVNYEIIGKDTISIKEVETFRYIEPPLLKAARGGCLSVVKVLVESGADINKYTSYKGYGAITASIVQKNMDIARYLIIDKKAEIPEYCFVPMDGEKMTITDLINYKQQVTPNFEKGSINYKIGEEIKEYLLSIGKR